jgi:CHAD domain-containing protein
MRQSGTNSVSINSNGRPVAGASAPGLALAPDTLEVLTRSLKNRWKGYRKRLKRCQRKLSERTVHDLRVEARRLLSLLDLLAHFLAPGRIETAQAVLKRHLDTFDELRDTQVQLAMVAELQKKFSAARCFHRFLKKREARLCCLARKDAKRLRNKSLGKLVNVCLDDARQRLKASGERQANFWLVRSIARAFEITHKLETRIDPQDTHSIHRTRIAFKKFRYMLEALAGHLPWANERLLTGLRLYQASMGAIQDAEVLLRAFEKFLRKEKAEARPALELMRELQRRRQQLIRTYLSAADHLSDFWPPTGAPAPARHRGASRPIDRRKTSRSGSPPRHSRNKTL